MENILYFSNKNNYKNVWCQTEDEIVAYGENVDLVAIKPNFESYLVATYNVKSTTSNTQLLGTSFDKSQIIEMHIDDVKLNNVVDAYTFDTIGEHTVKMYVKCMTSYDYMFSNCYSLTFLDLSYFNVSNVTNMSYMFYNCTNLLVINYKGDDNKLNDLFDYNKTYCPIYCAKINIDKPLTIRCNYWDKLHTEGKTYNMVLDNGCRAEYDAENDQYVFTFVPEKNEFKYDVYVDGIKEDYIKATNTLDVILINAQSIIYEEVLAISTSSPYNLIYSSFIQYVDAMFINGEEVSISSSKTFSETSQKKDIKIVFCDTTQLTDMSNMFYNCSSLRFLDLSSFDTSKATDMSGIFSECYSLTFLDLSSFDTSNVTDMSDMFYNCSGLTSLNLTHFDTSNVTSMSNMFYNCYNLISLNVSNFDTSKVTDMQYMFYNCQNLTSIEFSNSFNTSAVTNMSGIFDSCNSLTSLDVSSFDTSKVTRMYRMFHNCINLTSLDISNFDTSNVYDMCHMFGDCRNLTSLNLSNFDTSKVTTMEVMFSSCNKLTSIYGLDSFDTSNVNDMYWMFRECSGLTELDLSSFDTSKVTDMQRMFESCTNLTSITFGDKADVSNVTSYSNMFTSLPSNGTLTYPCAYSDAWKKLLNNLSSSWTKRCQSSEVTNKIKFIENGVELTNGNFTVNNVQCVYNETEKVWEVTHITEQQVYSVLRDGAEIGSVDNRKKINYILIGNNNDNYFSVKETISASSTSGSYTLIYSSFTKYIDVMFIDGVETTISSAKTFSSKGEHTIQMIMDTSKVTNMDHMFYYCSGLMSIDFGNIFDTSKVTDMRYMFYECRSLTSVTFGNNFNTSKVTDMKSMFNNCSGLTSLDLSSFDTSKVTNMEYMFERCNKLTSITFGNKANVSNVTSYSFMFNSLPSNGTLTYPCAYSDSWNKLLNNLSSSWTKTCQSSEVTNKIKFIENGIELSEGNFTVNGSQCVYNGTEKVWEVTYVAEQQITNVLCDGVEVGSVDNSFKVNHVFIGDNNVSYSGFSITETISASSTSSSYRLIYSSFTQYIDAMLVDGEEVSISSAKTFSSVGEHTIQMIIDTSNVTSMENMFSGCTALTSIEFSDSFNTSNVTNMCYMFNSCSGLTSLDLSNFNTSNVSNMNYMFSYCSGLTSLDLSSFDTSKVTDMSYMFCNCSGLTSLDLSKFDTSNVTSMYEMFYNCSYLTSLDLTHFDTSKVTNMSSMFFKCYNLTSLDLSSFDTSKVTYMSFMFNYCSDLTSLDLSNFDTSKVTNMNYMFSYCSGLTSLDLSSFNTVNVTDMSGMFTECSGLTSLDLSSFNTSNVTNMAYMFSQCNSLTSLTMTSDVPKLNNTNYMFSGITTNGIFTYPCMYDYGLITNKLPTSWTENCVSIANVTLKFVIIDNNIEITEGTVTVNDIAAIYSNKNKYWVVTYTIDEPYSDVILNGSNIGIIINSKYNNLQHILIGDCSNYVDISATYTATSANQTIPLFSDYTSGSVLKLSNIEAIYVDGKMITPSSSYTFTTVGEHDVKYFIKDGITTMSFYYAFYNIDYLKRIKFGTKFNNENCVSTLQDAFNSCDSLQFADLSNISMSANTSIEQLNNCFRSCSVLTSVYLPQNVDDIGDNCFYNCTSLTSINIPNSVKYIGYSAFTNCYSLSEIRIPSSVTSIDTACFAKCSGAISLIFEEGCQLNTIPTSGFMECDSLVTVTIPEGITSINTSAFYGCNNIKTITLPSTLTSIGNSGFSYCNSALTEIYSYAKTAPSISSSTFRSVKSNGTLHIPTNANYSSWLSTSSYYLGYYSWNSTNIYIPTACTSLNITALDVKGKETSTTISYTAVTNGIDTEGTEFTNVTITGTAKSAPFEQNTDTVNTVTRTIIFEYLGATANTEIIQGVYQNYSINLNVQWRLSTSISNPDSLLYDGVYESYTNKGVINSADICIITIEGYKNFTLYVRSYGESCCDYVVVSNLDCTLNSGTTSGTNVKATTNGKSTSDTSINGYTKVEFTNIDSDLHTIQVMYRKDNSKDSGNDRGYLLIPKNQ